MLLKYIVTHDMIKLVGRFLLYRNGAENIRMIIIITFH